MRIDPKPFTFDVLQRRLLVAGLIELTASMNRTLAKLRQRQTTESRGAEIDALEMELARTDDLLRTINHHVEVTP